MKGKFSVKSSYNVLPISSNCMYGWKNFWELGTVNSNQSFGLRLGCERHKILTIDKLRRRKHMIVNGCPKCLKDEEIENHIMIHRYFAQRVWAYFLSMFDMQWVMPCGVADLFRQW